MKLIYLILDVRKGGLDIQTVSLVSAQVMELPQRRIFVIQTVGSARVKSILGDGNVTNVLRVITTTLTASVSWKYCTDLDYVL